MEAVLKFNMARRLRTRVLGRHLAEGLWVRPWVRAGAVVVGVTVPQYRQLLVVGAVPDAEVLIRFSFSAAAPLPTPSLPPTGSSGL